VCARPFHDSDRDEMAGGMLLLLRRKATAAGAELMLLMDVLEHVADDAGLLAEQVRAAPPGADFIISVPAFGWLYSGHDVFLGHHRRYMLGGLSAVVRRFGLERVTRACLFELVLPIAARARLPDLLRSARWRDLPAQGQTKRQGGIANALLGAICGAELPHFTTNRIGGLTAVVHACRS